MIELGRIRHFNVRSRESVIKVILDLAAISVRCFGDISPSPLHSLAAFVVACELLHHLNSLIATVFPTDAVDRFPDRWRGRASDGSSAAFPRRGTLRDRFRVAIEGRTGPPYGRTFLLAEILPRIHLRSHRATDRGAYRQRQLEILWRSVISGVEGVAKSGRWPPASAKWGRGDNVEVSCIYCG